jgi:hypothetical protein
MILRIVEFGQVSERLNRFTARHETREKQAAKAGFFSPHRVMIPACEADGFLPLELLVGKRKLNWR